MNPAINFFLERIQAFSTNIFRIETDNKTTASSSDIISISLPQNSIVNLRSLKIFCSANANKGSTTAGARLAPINTFVERCEVSIGGVVLSSGANFVNVLLEAKRALGQEHSDSILGHPEYVRKTSYVNGYGATGTSAAALTTTVNEGYSIAYHDADNFAIDCFEGFINSAQPVYLDLSLIGEVKIRLYMGNDAILTTSAGPDLTALSFLTAGSGSARYELTNLHATIECVNLADRTYDEMVSNLIANQGYLEVPYKAYTSFQETHSGTTRFTVSASSLDRIWVTWRASTYNTQGKPIAVNGYKGVGGCVGATPASTTTTIEVGIPTYDVGGVFDTNKEKYRSNYFNFVEPSDGFKAQLQLNGAYFPNFQASVGELYGITKNSLPPSFPKQLPNLTLDQYRKNFCVQAFRLNMLGSENSRVLSGCDTRSSNLAGLITTTNVNSLSSPVINVFCETTEVLRIGAGRSIAVIS